eukprot:gb/GEZN01005796.1/.p1 GENE.gb/GEZN01005796.1/~~gb/GEZN01005796.1/.p1  ORF type:complete len:245 (+),score=45.59 gb/GEZN01005796.1/:84-737(+)
MLYDLHTAHRLEAASLSSAPYFPPTWTPSPAFSMQEQVPHTFRPPPLVQQSKRTSDSSAAHGALTLSPSDQWPTDQGEQTCSLFLQRGWCPGLETDINYNCGRNHLRTNLIKYCYMFVSKGTCYRKQLGSDCPYPHFSWEKVRSMASQTQEAQAARQLWLSGNQDSLLKILLSVPQSFMQPKKGSKKKLPKKKKKKQKADEQIGKQQAKKPRLDADT